MTQYNWYQLTQWGRVTHVCVGNLTIIGPDNGLSPGRRQAIIWTSAGILLIRSLGTNFSEILIGVQTFSFKKMHLKMSFAKWRPFCPGLNVLKHGHHWPHHWFWCLFMVEPLPEPMFDPNLILSNGLIFFWLWHLHVWWWYRLQEVDTMEHVADSHWWGYYPRPRFTKRTDVLVQDSKPWDSGLDFPNRSKIWQAPRQQRCWDACQISERYNRCNIQSRGFSRLRDFRDLAVRCPST